VKIDSTSISGSHVKVVVQKKKVKVIKMGTLKQGEESSEMMVEEGTRCSCDVLAGFSRAQTYLLMGRKKGSRLVITYIQPVNKQSSALQQVLPLLLLLLLYSHCIVFSYATSLPPRISYLAVMAGYALHASVEHHVQQRYDACCWTWCR
jgi:hypothetical protein